MYQLILKHPAIFTYSGSPQSEKNTKIRYSTAFSHQINIERVLRGEPRCFEHRIDQDEPIKKTLVIANPLLPILIKKDGVTNPAEYNIQLKNYCDIIQDMLENDFSIFVWCGENKDLIKISTIQEFIAAAKNIIPTAKDKICVKAAATLTLPYDAICVIDYCLMKYMQQTLSQNNEKFAHKLNKQQYFVTLSGDTPVHTACVFLQDLLLAGDQHTNILQTIENSEINLHIPEKPNKIPNKILNDVMRFKINCCFCKKVVLNKAIKNSSKNSSLINLIKHAAKIYIINMSCILLGHNSNLPFFQDIFPKFTNISIKKLKNNEVALTDEKFLNTIPNITHLALFFNVTISQINKLLNLYRLTVVNLSYSNQILFYEILGTCHHLRILEIKKSTIKQPKQATCKVIVKLHQFFIDDSTEMPVNLITKILHSSCNTLKTLQWNTGMLELPNIRLDNLTEFTTYINGPCPIKTNNLVTLTLKDTINEEIKDFLQKNNTSKITTLSLVPDTDHKNNLEIIFKNFPNLRHLSCTDGVQLNNKLNMKLNLTRLIFRLLYGRSSCLTLKNILSISPNLLTLELSTSSYLSALNEPGNVPNLANLKSVIILFLQKNDLQDFNNFIANCQSLYDLQIAGHTPQIEPVENDKLIKVLNNLVFLQLENANLQPNSINIILTHGINLSYLGLKYCILPSLPQLNQELSSALIKKFLRIAHFTPEFSHQNTPKDSLDVSLNHLLSQTPGGSFAAHQYFSKKNKTFRPENSRNKAHSLLYISTDNRNKIIFNSTKFNSIIQANTQLVNHNQLNLLVKKDNDATLACVPMCLIGNKAEPLPVTKCGDKITFLYCEKEVEIGYETISDQYYIKAKHNSYIMHVQVKYIIKAKPANLLKNYAHLYNNNMTSDFFVQQIYPYLPDEILQSIAQYFKDKHAPQLISVICEYLRSFGSPPTESHNHSTKKSEFANFIKYKFGSCLCRTYIAKIIFDYCQIPARIVTNQIHAFLETIFFNALLNLWEWQKFELGGYQAIVKEIPVDDTKDAELNKNSDTKIDEDSEMNSPPPSLNVITNKYLREILTEKAIISVKSSADTINLFSSTLDTDTITNSRHKNISFHLADNRAQQELFVYQLLKFCAFMNKDTFYINSQNNLESGLNAVKITNGKYEIVPGEISEFCCNHKTELRMEVDSNPDTSSCKKILIINWKTFESSDMQKFQSVMDTKPTLNGIPLDSNVFIINLIDNGVLNKANAAFCSRLGKTTRINLSMTTNEQPLLEPFYQNKPKNHITSPIEIDLFKSNELASSLIGSIQIDNAGNMRFKKGILLETIDIIKLENNNVRLSINNFPTNDYFKFFITNMLFRKKIFANGQFITLPEQLEITLRQTSHPPLEIPTFDCNDDVSYDYICNLSTLNTFFKIIYFEEGVLKQARGIIECNKNHTIRVLVDEKINGNQCRQLIKHANEHNCVLKLFRDTKNLLKTNSSGELQNSLQRFKFQSDKNILIIKSSNLKETDKIIKAVYSLQEIIIISVDKTIGYSDTVIHTYKNNDDVMCTEICDVWRRLQHGSTICFLGDASKLLSDFAPTFCENPHMMVFGEKIIMRGKIIFATNKNISNVPSNITCYNHITNDHEEHVNFTIDPKPLDLRVTGNLKTICSQDHMFFLDLRGMLTLPSFMEKLKEIFNNDGLFWGIKEFAKSYNPTSTNKKILLLDISNSQDAKFVRSILNKLHALFNGKIINITEESQIILYKLGVHSPTLLPQTLINKIPSYCMPPFDVTNHINLGTKILEAFPQTDDDKGLTIINFLYQIYNWINDNCKNLISIRQLTSLFILCCDKASNSELLNMHGHFARQLLRRISCMLFTLLHPDDREKFQKNQTDTHELPNFNFSDTAQAYAKSTIHNLNNENFVYTDNMNLAVSILNDCLLVRNFTITNPNTPVLLGAILIGAPAIGKSSMLQDYLQQQEIPYASITPINGDELRNKLEETYNEGCTLIIDEIDQWANVVLKFITQPKLPPKKPGFMIFGTMNWLLKGCKLLPPAFKEYFMIIKLQKHSKEELFSIIKHNYPRLSSLRIKELVDNFYNAEVYNNYHNDTNQSLTLRQLLEAAATITQSKKRNRPPSADDNNDSDNHKKTERPSKKIKTDDDISIGGDNDDNYDNSVENDINMDSDNDDNNPEDEIHMRIDKNEDYFDPNTFDHTAFFSNKISKAMQEEEHYFTPPPPPFSD